MKKTIKIGLPLLLVGLMFVVAYFVAPLFNFSDAGLILAEAPVVLTAAELKLKEDLLGEIKTTVEKQLDTRAKKDEVKAEIALALKQFEGIPLDELRSMLSADKGVMAMLVKQGAEITAMKESKGNEKDLSIRGQIAGWRDKNKDALARIKAGQKADLTELELRVASPMTPANTLNSSSYLPKPFIEAGIHDIRRIAPTFWDYLPKGRTNQAAYVWVNKKNPLGAAGFIGPGVAKPGVSFELETEISNAKKVAVSDKIAMELLDDIDGMASYVEMELRYQLDAKTNTTLLTGTVSSTVPAGITTFAVSYSLAGIATDNPNNFDCIRAAVAQIRTHYINDPVTVFVNPVDAANMDLTKADTSGTYLLPPFSTANGQVVAGAQVVEDNNITQGRLLAACLGLFKTLIYKDFTLSYGWENDDFTKNLVTVIAERRLHSFHSSVDEQAFIYDTFAQIKVEIAAS